MSSNESDESATLVLRRPPSPWVDRLRSYVIRVNGVPVSKIRDGGELVVPLHPGRHHVEARIDWTGSLPVEVVLQAGEVVVLGVEPAGGPVRSFGHLFGRHRYLTLGRIA